MKIFLILSLSLSVLADYRLSDEVNLKTDGDIILEVPGLKVFPYQIKNENKYVVNFESKVTNKIETQSFNKSFLSYAKVKLINNKTRLILIFKEPVKLNIQTSQLVFTKLTPEAKQPEISSSPTISPSSSSNHSLQKILFHSSNQPLELYFGYKPDFTLIKLSDSNYTIDINNVEKPSDSLLLPYYPNSEVAGIISVYPKFENNRLSIVIESDQKLSAFSTDTGINIRLTN